MIASGGVAHSAREPASRIRRLPALRLTVGLVVVALIAGFLASRLRLLEGEVERTQFVHLVRALQLAVASEALVLDARGDVAGLRVLAESNPILLLKPPPANYRGEIREEKPSNDLPGSWFFDLRLRELVYVPRVARAMQPPSTRIARARFKLVEARSDDGIARTEPERTKDAALRLIAIEVPPWLENPAAGPRMLP